MATQSSGATRVALVVSGFGQAGTMIWGATATDGVLAVLLSVFGGLAALGTLIGVAK